jgi:hypothetical protein
MPTPAPDTLQVNKLDELKPANPNETPAVEVTVAYTGTCEGAVENFPSTRAGARQNRQCQDR